MVECYNGQLYSSKELSTIHINKPILALMGLKYLYVGIYFGLVCLYLMGCSYCQSNALIDK